MTQTRKSSVKVEFRVVPGSRLRKGDAVILGTAFERIKASGKDLTAETLLADAATQSSALHRFFEWDNNKAAHQYRLEQARRLIRSVEVVLEDAKGKKVPMRAYFSVRNTEGTQSYQPMEYVFDSPDLTDQVKEDAKTQLEGWLARFKRYEWAESAAPGVVAALRALKATLGASSRRRKSTKKTK